MRKLFFFIFLTLNFYYRSAGQDIPPATDIWVIQLKLSTNNSFTIANYKKITENPGYDNQPYFIPPLKSLLYVSDNGGSQTDIYQFDLETAVSKRVLKTEYYKEYSPMRSYDGKYISCISVEPDNTSQRFWEFPYGGGMGKPLFPDIINIGYYTWLNEDLVAFFRLGDKEAKDTLDQLDIGNITTGELQNLDERIGRCILRSRNHPWIYYVKKYDSENWKIRCYDYERSVYKGDIVLPKGQEDFTLGPNDMIWLGNNGKIIEASIQNPTWKTVLDFNSLPFKNFYRLVYSADFNYLALVTYEGKKP